MHFLTTCKKRLIIRSIYKLTRVKKIKQFSLNLKHNFELRIPLLILTKRINKNKNFKIKVPLTVSFFTYLNLNRDGLKKLKRTYLKTSFCKLKKQQYFKCVHNKLWRGYRIFKKIIHNYLYIFSNYNTVVDRFVWFSNFKFLCFNITRCFYIFKKYFIFYLQWLKSFIFFYNNVGGCTLIVKHLRKNILSINNVRGFFE